MIHEIEYVINEIRLTYHSLIKTFDKVHGDQEITVGMRAVLEFIDREGPRTVPQIARARNVTRQHIQTLVNQLLDQNWVECVENPDHKSSSLISMSSKGKNKFNAMKKLEHELYKRIDWGLTPSGAQSTIRNLKKFREALNHEVSK